MTSYLKMTLKNQDNLNNENGIKVLKNKGNIKFENDPKE